MGIEGADPKVTPEETEALPADKQVTLLKHLLVLQVFLEY